MVIHRPAEVAGDPVVNSYATPVKPIGPGKARVLLAHTATVAPADVRVDGQVVFENIANGEFAEADVPAGAHKVELLPTGLTTDPILGPLDVDLKPRTVTMVYAVGSPTDQSMNVIVHTAQLVLGRFHHAPDDGHRFGWAGRRCARGAVLLCRLARLARGRPAPCPALCFGWHGASARSWPGSSSSGPQANTDCGRPPKESWAIVDGALG